jgi:hypothetical protein
MTKARDLGDLLDTSGDVKSGSLDNVSVDDSKITAMNASKLTGTVADARISTLTASKLTGALPAISGASLTGLTGGANIQMRTGSFNGYGGAGGSTPGPITLSSSFLPKCVYIKLDWPGGQNTNVETGMVNSGAIVSMYNLTDPWNGNAYGNRITLTWSSATSSGLVISFSTGGNPRATGMSYSAILIG